MCEVSTVLHLGSEVRLEKLVELFVIILGKVDSFLLAPVLAVQDQVGVVVEDPLDLHVRILVDTAPLLEEPLDAGQPIEPSGVARDDLARLVSSRAMQRQQRERQRSPSYHARWRSAPPCRGGEALQRTTPATKAPGSSAHTHPHSLEILLAKLGASKISPPGRRAAAPRCAAGRTAASLSSSGMPEVECKARVADGIFRGGALGLLWSVWFGPSECWSAQKPFRHNALQLSKRTGMYVLGFSSFLACYNGLFCGCERSFGRDSAASPVAAGGLVGLAVGAMIPPVRVATMLSTAGMCAGLCGAGHAMGAVWRT